jgi:hypothetical protein
MKINLVTRNTQAVLQDLFGTTYHFTRWRFGDRPSGVDCVYCFVNSGANVVLYIGKTGDLSARLSSHEATIVASLNGADELWVHQPTMLGDDYHVVEARLIEAYRPPLNRQQPNPGGLFGLLNGDAPSGGGRSRP